MLSETPGNRASQTCGTSTCRAGRTTAPRMKVVYHTDPTNPAQSLIKLVAYPEAFKLSTAATTWGCTHEKAARNTYTSLTRKSHNYFAVDDVGLTLNPEWPHIGASPDGRVSCSCCGSGVIEVKCPYSQRNSSNVEDKTFCLVMQSDGAALQLNRSHAYYYQVQTQIFMCRCVLL